MKIRIMKEELETLGFKENLGYFTLNLGYNRAIRITHYNVFVKQNEDEVYVFDYELKKIKQLIKLLS